MQRLKPSIKNKESLSRFQITVSKTNTKFKWNECCWCDYEFRRENGYEIYMNENFNVLNPSETYYVCHKCSKDISIEDMRKIWEESNQYKIFKARGNDD